MLKIRKIHLFRLATAFSLIGLSACGKSANTPSSSGNNSNTAPITELSTKLNEDSAKNTSKDIPQNTVGEQGNSRVKQFELPSEITMGAVAWTGNEFLAWGVGGIMDNPRHIQKHGYRFDPKSKKIIAMNSTNEPSPRMNPFYAWTGNAMLVFGGSEVTDELNNSPNVLTDGSLYTPENDSWSPIPSPPPDTNPSEPGGFALNAFDNGNFVYLKMYSNKAFGAVYNLESKQWTALNMTGCPFFHHKSTIIVSSSKIILLGEPIQKDDEASKKYLSQAVYDLKSSAEGWKIINVPNRPTLREGYELANTNKGILVWGGTEIVQDQNGLDSFGKFLADGAIFNPESNTWTPISTQGAPQYREDGDVFVDGDQVIFWGGGSWEKSDPVGIIYNLSSSTWGHPTESTPELKVAVGPTTANAVWTGKSVIGIFGKQVTEYQMFDDGQK